MGSKSVLTKTIERLVVDRQEAFRNRETTSIRCEERVAQLPRIDMGEVMRIFEEEDWRTVHSKFADLDLMLLKSCMDICRVEYKNASDAIVMYHELITKITLSCKSTID